MTKEELAGMLDDIKYLSKLNMGLFKDTDLVVVYGESDDLMEFRGAIDDEYGCYDGCIAYLDASGLVYNDCGSHDCPYFLKRKDQATTIEALWEEEGYSWTFKTNIPHATFDILRDNHKFCRGIVFNLGSVGRSKK